MIFILDPHSSDWFGLPGIGGGENWPAVWAGMQVVIDLVPNHVARSYHSVVHPEWDFGASDDQSRFFAGSNSFYYVSGGPLVLSHPSGWAPSVSCRRLAIPCGLPMRKRWMR